jgi:hypothetical protein
MLTVLMATALVAQYPTPQATYAAPPPGVPYSYSAPAPTQGQLVIVQPGPFSRIMGRIGQRMVECSLPRVRMAPPVSQQVVQVSYAAPPQNYGSPQNYGAPQTYAAPQSPGQSAARPAETVPPVPPR